MKVLFFSSNFQGVRKISALLVCMLFVFVFVISPIKVKAEAFPIPPLWLPMNPYNSQGLEGNYVLLNDDQKKIVKEVIGAVNTVYLGMGGYSLVNPVIGVQATREFYQKYGDTFLNTLWSQIMGTSRAMTDFVGSTIYKASTYETYSDYEADSAPGVTSSDHKYFQISPELTVAFKNWYRANGGVEDWQNTVQPFVTQGFTWVTKQLSGTLQTTYDTYLSQMDGPLVEWSISGFQPPSPYYQYIYYNYITTSNARYDLWVDTSTNVVRLVNTSGTNTVTRLAYDNYYGSIVYNNATINTQGYSFNSDNYSSYVELVRDCVCTYNHPLMYLYGQGYSNYQYYPVFTDFIDNYVVGSTYADAQPIYNIDNLNIGDTDSEYIQNIDDVGYVDINTLIGTIADEVVNLREVVEESVLVKDGDTAIPYADSLQIAIDKYINQPESGVVIPVDIFDGLTGPNGPVSYLWFMTKPLISYTGDLLGLLTLDGDGSFQFTGLGYIVVGVVTVGIIGGLVTKCLL